MNKAKIDIPRSKFNRRSTAEEVTEGVDLTGKTAFVTGVNSGLGLESMRVLAKRGAHVIGAARTMEKAMNACAGVDGQTTAIACELSDFDSVKRCADEVVVMNTPIDILMCNAGIMAPAELQTKCGIEMQFLTNHLGHFVLVNRLLEQVLKAEAGRIVMLSSMGHQQSPKSGIDFDNLSGDKGYDAWKFYGQSKLANLLMANELAKRLRGSTATANAVHPGVIRTNLARSTGGIASRLISTVARLFERTIAQGAATQCYVAAHANMAGVSGEYFVDCNPAKPSKHGRDGELASRLWRESEILVSDYL
jgi:NAD(P)-dependent dehydrogenase (short-subunit alcohol dehydrogenase family)